MAGILLVARALLEPAPRTPGGDAVRAQLVAFRQHLAAVDPGRLPPEQRQAAFAGLLPYAVVLALAPQLAHALQAAGVGFGYADPMWFNTFLHRRDAGFLAGVVRRRRWLLRWVVRRRWRRWGRRQLVSGGSAAGAAGSR